MSAPLFPRIQAPLFLTHGKANVTEGTESSLQALVITYIPQCSGKSMHMSACQAWRSLGFSKSIFWYFLPFLSPLPSPPALSVQRQTQFLRNKPTTPRMLSLTHRQLLKTQSTLVHSPTHTSQTFSSSAFLAPQCFTVSLFLAYSEDVFFPYFPISLPALSPGPQTSRPLLQVTICLSFVSLFIHGHPPQHPGLPRISPAQARL